MKNRMLKTMAFAFFIGAVGLTAAILVNDSETEAASSGSFKKAEKSIVKDNRAKGGIKCPTGEDVGAAGEGEEQANAPKTKPVFQLFRQPPPIDQIKPEKTQQATFALG